MLDKEKGLKSGEATWSPTGGGRAAPDRRAAAPGPGGVRPPPARSGRCPAGVLALSLTVLLAVAIAASGSPCRADEPPSPSGASRTDEPESPAGAEGSASGTATPPSRDAAGDRDEIPSGALEELRRLIASKKGKPLIVTLWATWCAPCVREIPVFNEAMERFEKEGLQVLGVSVDSLTEPDPFAGHALVSRFARAHDIAYELFYYDGDPDPLGGEFDWPGPIPFSVIFNADGKMMDTLVGTMPEAVLLNRIGESLRENAKPRPGKKLI